MAGNFMTASRTYEELSLLLRAHYPIIWMVTHEENRAKHILLEYCRAKGMELHSWTFTEGLRRVDTDPPGAPKEIDPIQLLDHILKANINAVWMLRDLHPFIDPRGGPDVIRKLRDLLADRGRYRPIVIVSPVLQIPVELQKSITVIDLDLPNLAEIEEAVKGAISQISSRKKDWEPPSEDEVEAIVKACKGLTIDEIENILARSWIQSQTFNVDVMLTEKKQAIRKSGLLEYFDANVEFGSIGGMDQLKVWMQERSIAFSEAARKFGLRQPKGVLLLGPPGVGKSYLAKGVANLWKMPCVRMDVGKIFAGIVGQSEQNMRQAISTVESLAPCVLWIDEIEKGFSGTGSSNFSDAGTASRVFGSFLTWLTEKEAAVFVVATANDVRQLPPELLRKGRFDEIFFVDLPSDDERKDIFRIHVTKPRELNPGRDAANFDLDELSAATAGFSGAEIEESVIAAMFKAFSHHEELATKHILEAINETKPLSQTMSEVIDYIRDWAKNRARFASSGASPATPGMSGVSLFDNGKKLKVKRG